MTPFPRPCCPGGASPRCAILLGLLGLGLEYARVAMWHPEIVLWSICLLCVCLTLLVFRLWSSVAFPGGIISGPFFLTAVPWPPRIEQPLTAALMRSVASATVELLHWLGIEAIVSGGAIALQSGLVGITEACSGIRSLQAGIMFGLAMGEWFLLRPSRRMWLLLLAVILALLSNLARTLTLALQAEWHGGAAVERIHDFAGNVAVTALVLAIALGAKLLAGRKRSPIDSGQDAVGLTGSQRSNERANLDLAPGGGRTSRGNFFGPACLRARRGKRLCAARAALCSAGR